MLENFKTAKQAQVKAEDITGSSGHVTSTDQSDLKDGSGDQNGTNDAESSQKDSKLTSTGLTDEEESEYRQLRVLYEILSGYILDYCHLLFVVSSGVLPFLFNIINVYFME